MKISAEDIAFRGNGTGLEYMCPTRHFVYIFFSPVFQLSTAKNEINLFNNHVLIVAPVTFAPADAMTPSSEFLFSLVADKNTNFDINVELQHNRTVDRRMDGQPDKRKSGCLSRKVRRSGRCFMQDLMVV